uniref:Diacylglycerol kinase n=1 Tax=Denticeps clupeoides TaxID=299321 RepID=A0AAY4C0N1_9TELE
MDRSVLDNPGSLCLMSPRTDSTMNVKDVLKEFHAGGKLVQYRLGDRVDQTGFSLFLKSYLEVEDLPSDLCQHLYRHTGEFFHKTWRFVCVFSDGVCLKAVSCYFSVLEEGKPRDKLEFTFKLYDKDGNGVLDKPEVDIIITQMMRAADYLGWDVTELRPVLEDTMRAIDADNSGTVTLQEWVLGGMNNIPLLVLLGLKASAKNGQHIWRMKNFNRPTHCCVCEGMLMGLRKQGLCCNVCKYTVHSRCANKNSVPCIRTYVRETLRVVPRHGMRACVCVFVCKLSINSHQCTPVKRCFTFLKRHDECVSLGSSECDCGPLKDHILPPWAIYPLVKVITPVPQTHPLMVFVNPKSGGKQGERVLRKFQYLLNPRQVFNLSNGGPNPGEKVKIVACLISPDRAELVMSPPVAVLPLGTGNDLARCLRWGGGYEGSDLTETLRELERAVVVPMDRWSVRVVPDNPQDEGDPVPYEIINNYFSIGVDASIAHRFHTMREKNPQKFNSRAKNKLCYFELATSETISASCKKLNDCLTVECCGVQLDLSNLHFQGIAILNIPSMHGGSNLWGESKKDSEGKDDRNLPEVITDRDMLKMSSQDLSDKRLEVVGLEGAMEMGQIYTGLKSKGHRLAQTSQITIRTNKALPMQIDGEPWMQPACTVSLVILSYSTFICISFHRGHCELSR